MDLVDQCWQIITGEREDSPSPSSSSSSSMEMRSGTQTFTSPLHNEDSGDNSLFGYADNYEEESSLIGMVSQPVVSATTMSVGRNATNRNVVSVLSNSDIRNKNGIQPNRSQSVISSLVRQVCLLEGTNKLTASLFMIFTVLFFTDE